MKPKEYLVSVGALPPGSENKRGRLSLDNIELLKKAAAEGKNIEGYSVTRSVSTPDKPSEPVVTKEKVSTDKVIHEVHVRFTEDDFVAYEFVDGKRKFRSLREACRHCRCSLVGCWCEQPEIVSTDGTGSVRVHIERKRDNSS